ncbi:hypothetical protein [Nordella sp. HKS 07]|nr:hypothetical protein [Nordella sp. HKS 07]
MSTQTGILATAKGATPEKGEIQFKEYVADISAATREAFGLGA